MKVLLSSALELAEAGRKRARNHHLRDKEPETENNDSFENAESKAIRVLIPEEGI